MAEYSLPKASGIYQITCRTTGKSYIGKAVSIARRWNQHKVSLNHGTHRSPRLQYAWKKYGPDDFYCEVLELVTEGQEALLVREQWHLDERKRRKGDKEYNICEQASGPLGVKRTRAARKRMSLSHLGKQWSPARKAAGRTGQPANLIQRMILAEGRERLKEPEIQEKRAESRRRRLREEGFTEAELAYHERKKGSTWSPARWAAHEAQKDQPPSPKRQAANEALRGKKASPETRAKMSASHQARLARRRAEEALHPTQLIQPSLFGEESAS